MQGGIFLYLLPAWLETVMPMPDSGHIYLNTAALSLAGLIVTQIGNVFVCKTEKDSFFKMSFLSNRLVLLGIAQELMIVSVFICIPFFQRIFGLAPIGLKEWGFLLAFTPVLFLMEKGRTWIVRRWRDKVTVFL